MNKFIFIGNLAKDPVLKDLTRGLKVCEMRLAVSKELKGKEVVDYFNVFAWNAQAENCAKYLKKGRKICCEGYVRNRSYEDKDGNKKYACDFEAISVEFLGVPDKKEEQGEPIEEQTKIALEEIKDDELPF